ncbi:fumarate hydratase [Bradyrhizobium roseum]|uniref:fumarate hydratase n=1 Tax=Bradyrhizobium roseum TaxID=3056648 RepID=UPI0026260802|nr:fumarate hydratase [Bradyrhizobium roseus]WKA26805.1 fumarate hydratase [Bradyrhizobium roseus]
MNAPTAFPEQKPVPPYKHTPLFPLGADTTPYKKITAEGVRVEKVLGKDMLVVSREALRALSEAAFGDINHYLRPGHLKQLRSILDDKEASDNDKFVAFDFLKNANIAAGGVLPMCQDTGTAIIMGKKGCNVITDGDDEAALSEGARDAYLRRNLRYSQVAPLSMYEEKNTANNMPAQCEIYAEGGSSEVDSAYKFMFMAKGGGSANKSFLFQATPSVLTKDRLLAFLKEKVLTLGTAACPPYHLAIVIGGTSAELCMKTVKLASARYLDALPTQGSADGNAFRDLEMEQEILKMTQSLGVGAQFGGKYFCHDVRVIRMPRHGASLPIGLGVSCSADRQVLGKITKDGVYLEELEHNPAQYLPEVEQSLGGEVVKIDLNKPMKEILATLSQYPIKTRVSMTGTMIVARDSAHAKLRERLERGEPLPDYFKNHPVYYAGPAKTPDGYASGAFGPTTAGRMDSFVDQFQAAGGSMVMVAKGNRAVAVREACKKYGGFYLGSIGGAAANLAEHCIKKVEVVEYPELGMEAIWRIEVVDFPAFIIVDDKGNDFFKELNLG